MEPQDRHDHFSDLMGKYLSGNTDAAEQQELERWVLADPANRERFVGFRKAWLLTGMRERAVVDVDTEWERTAAQLFPEAKVRELSARKQRPTLWRIAAAVVVLLVSAALLYRYTQPGAPFFAEATDVTMPYDLSDGTRVTLNKASSIRFVPENEQGERAVQLTGDAFFDVARDEAAPFVITTQAVEVEVLGTSFYVDSRTAAAEVQVTVASGSVAVRAGDQEVILTRDEQAVYDKASDRLTKRANIDENYLSIKSGELVFVDTPLAEAVFALNRHFNSRLKIGEDVLQACGITSTFNNKSLPEILMILEASFGIIATEDGADTVLTGSCTGE